MRSFARAAYRTSLDVEGLRGSYTLVLPRDMNPPKPQASEKPKVCFNKLLIIIMLSKDRSFGLAYNLHKHEIFTRIAAARWYKAKPQLSHKLI